MSSRKPVTTHVTLEGCNVNLDNSHGALDVRQFVLKNVHMSFQISPELTGQWAQSCTAGRMQVATPFHLGNGRP